MTEVTLEKGSPKYTDHRKVTVVVFFAAVLYAIIFVYFEMFFTAGIAWFGQGIFPTSQICECPSNAASQDKSSYFYADCVDDTSKWWMEHNNASLVNKTFTLQGFFQRVDFSRANLTTFSCENSEGGSSIPLIYQCPLVKPFYVQPLDFIETAFLALSVIAISISVVRSTIKSTTIFSDRVEVKYWYTTEVYAVPLWAIVGEPEKNEYSGIPPVRDAAMTLKTTELIVFKDKNTTQVTLQRGEQKKKLELRVEPERKEEFMQVLADTKIQCDSKTHYFEGEIPKLPWTVADDDNEEPNDVQKYSWKPSPYMFGYWFRQILLTAVVIAFFVFAFRFVIYWLNEYLQPNRPKPCDALRKEVLNFGPDAWTITTVVGFQMVFLIFAQLPSKISISENIISIFLEEGNLLDDNATLTETVVIQRKHLLPMPKDYNTWSYKLFEFPFVAYLGTQLKATEWYSIQRNAKKFLVTKKAFPEKGEIVTTEKYQTGLLDVPTEHENSVAALTRE
eukprot:g3022.t1